MLHEFISKTAPQGPALPLEDGDAPVCAIMKARWDFSAAQPDELSFKKDDIIINVVRSEEPLEQWATGTVESSGAEGLFPLNYVKPVETERED